MNAFKRLLISLLGLAMPLAAALPARAGDTSTLEVLGFSSDASVFAFEEYGIQDGSGFAYANRFYIDVDRDQFLPDTPIRVRIDDESVPVEKARSEAREKGERIMLDSELAKHRGTLAGFNPPTELGTDPYRMQVNPRPVFAPVDEPLEFRLTEIDAAPPQNCKDVEGIKGFRLERIVNGSATVLFSDKQVPSSRGCPQGYAIGGVQTIFLDGSKPAFSVLVVVRGMGFEGPDHRWLAVTGRF